MITREDIVREARALIGTKFRHQGRDPETGIDCLGLLVCVARALGHEPTSDFTNYPRRPDPQKLLAGLRGELTEIAIDEARDGDVVMIRLPREEEATHLGILADGRYDLMLIHAKGPTAGDGRVNEEPFRRWAKYVATAFRFKEMAEDG